jgi:GDP/UDP-N,N'-diacetylbacillosamine 2-epimerase (hydrolysing)
MRKICIFTSTRAEWGLLRGLADAIRRSDSLKLQLLVSGAHLSERFGMTVSEIEGDGFDISERVDILKFDDTPAGICETMGLALKSYGEALERLHPGLLVILGDRYEAFCAAAAAQILRIPAAHIHGGETTEGAVDEAFRHSITKMAHLHFPSCEEYRRRIIQLGEHPSRVFNVGALGIENIRKISLMSRAELEASIQFKLNKPFFLVTFHPVTLEDATAGVQFNELLSALEQFPEHKIIFTKANADADGQVINGKIDAYASARPERCLAVASLGLRRYLSAMSLCNAVVGNSSSGILETPVFGIPTVNIGDRQKGRLRTPSIIDCKPDCESVVSAIQKALDPRFRACLENVNHPCEKPGTARVIVNVLETISLEGILKKTFFDMEAC